VRFEFTTGYSLLSSNRILTKHISTSGLLVDWRQEDAVNRLRQSDVHVANHSVLQRKVCKQMPGRKWASRKLSYDEGGSTTMRSWTLYARTGIILRHLNNAS
jgi:hypothetical protein